MPIKVELLAVLGGIQVQLFYPFIVGALAV
jgi:hypothetical protein